MCWRPEGFWGWNPTSGVLIGTNLVKGRRRTRRRVRYLLTLHSKVTMCWLEREPAAKRTRHLITGVSSKSCSLINRKGALLLTEQGALWLTGGRHGGGEEGGKPKKKILAAV